MGGQEVEGRIRGVWEYKELRGVRRVWEYKKLMEYGGVGVHEVEGSTGSVDCGVWSDK